MQVICLRGITINDQIKDTGSKPGSEVAKIKSL